MAGGTFIRNSRVGRSSYQLRNDQIEVSKLTGKRIDLTFPLQTLSPEYSRGSRQFLHLFIVPGFALITGVGVMVFVLGQETFPHGFALYPVMLAVMGAWGMVRATPRTEYFQFYDHWKKPAFFIVREKAQAEECDGYVRLLLAEIERVNRGEKVAQTKAAATSTVFLPHPQDSYFAREIRWQISLIMGGLAVGVPLIPNANEYLGDLLFIQLVVCSLAGVVCAFLSFQSKERFRHVALIGAALSVLATVIYSGPLR